MNRGQLQTWAIAIMLLVWLLTDLSLVRQIEQREQTIISQQQTIVELNKEIYEYRDLLDIKFSGE